jgi:hypothetical protein
MLHLIMWKEKTELHIGKGWEGRVKQKMIPLIHCYWIILLHAVISVSKVLVLVVQDTAL